MKMSEIEENKHDSDEEEKDSVRTIPGTNLILNKKTGKVSNRDSYISSNNMVSQDDSMGDRMSSKRHSRRFVRFSQDYEHQNLELKSPMEGENFKNQTSKLNQNLGSKNKR